MSDETLSRRSFMGEPLKFGGLLAAVEVVGRVLRRPRVQAWTERVSGALLMGSAGRRAASA
jgi:threonine/homoserine/homoserine lactone efflux protein